MRPEYRKSSAWRTRSLMSLCSPWVEYHQSYTLQHYVIRLHVYTFVTRVVESVNTVGIMRHYNMIFIYIFFCFYFEWEINADNKKKKCHFIRIYNVLNYELKKKMLNWVFERSGLLRENIVFLIIYTFQFLYINVFSTIY